MKEMKCSYHLSANGSLQATSYIIQFLQKVLLNQTENSSLKSFLKRWYESNFQSREIAPSTSLIIECSVKGTEVLGQKNILNCYIYFLDFLVSSQSALYRFLSVLIYLPFPQ